MWRYSLLRLGGVIGLFIALIFAIVQTAQKNIPTAVIAWLLVAVGLWIAVMGDKRIDRMKAESMKAKAEAAQQFSDHQLEIAPKWTWLLIGCAFFVSIAFITGNLLFVKKQVASALVATAVAIGFVSLLGISVRFVRLTLLAISHGYLIKFGPTGVAIAGRGEIPWSAVRGVDLRVDEVKGISHYTLVLAIEHAFILGGGSMRNVLRFFAGAVAIEPGKDLLNIPCNLLGIDPHVMAQAARVIGDRYGARRLKNWRYTQPIEVAIQEDAIAARIKEADERLQHLLDQMKRMDKTAEPDSEKLRKLDQEVARAFGESQTAMTARVKLFEVEAKRLQKQSRTALWVMLAGLVFGLGVILMKVLLVTGK